MWFSKLKQASRKKRQIAALNFPQRNWNLTQKLQKSSAKQLRSELKWLLVICVLSGSCPITVFPSYGGYIFTTMHNSWLITLLAWLCLAAYWELMHSSIKINELEHKFYCIESITYLIHIPCIMLISQSWKQKIEVIFDRIAQFDLESGYITEIGSISRYIRYYLYSMLVFIVYYTINDFSYCHYNVFKTFLDLSTYLLPNILSFISIIPYFMLLQGVFNRLCCLKESLKLELPNGSYKIQKLRLQHVNLLHFTKSINQSFGVSILCVYVSSFFNVNTNLFLAYKNIEEPNLEDWAWWIDILLWLFMHLSKMFIILYYNHRVQQEQSKCLNLLHKIRTENAALIQTVNHFVLQLQMDVRAFVACGLIVLDYKFIATLMMAITNVFIFILQYEITYQALSAVNETKV